MKRLVAIVLVLIMLVGCSRSISVNEKEVEPYGLFNDHKKNSQIVYRINPGDVVWSIILIETIIAPVLIIGYDIYEPVGVNEK